MPDARTESAYVDSQAGTPGLTTRPPWRHFLLTLFYYSVMLCAVFALSWWYLMPHFLMLRMRDEILSVNLLPQQHQRLEAELLQREAERMKSLGTVRDPLFASLKAGRAGTPMLTTLLPMLEQEARRHSHAGVQVSLERIKLDPAGRTLELSGDVHAGIRTLTVLAQFIDALGKLPSVDHLTHTPLTRLGTNDTDFTAPFRITLHLQ